MNKNALTKIDKRKVKTATGKIPDSYGFPSGKVSGGGVIRKLTKKEIEAQRKLQKI